MGPILVGPPHGGIGGVGLHLLSCWVAWDVFHGGYFNGPVYVWAIERRDSLWRSLIDSASAVMMVDARPCLADGAHLHDWLYGGRSGLQPDSSVTSPPFTFVMLMLDVEQLPALFGWEGVGLVSYLLNGFWYERESAIRANLKQFSLNRVGRLWLYSW